MGLLEELNFRNEDVSRKLFILAEEVSKEATIHLKLIINQLPEFDIHDETHSLKIIDNIELLIGEDSIKNLSSYELFLLYMSGFLHDCAMALPAWELNLLTMTEGKNGFTKNSILNPIPNDGKKPYKLSEALKVINENKESLYINFDKTQEFIFSFSTEIDFQRDLAKRLIKYQEFRNGYSQELKKLEEKGDVKSYLEFSDLLRYDFVRITHAERVETYINNLSRRFINSLGGAWGEALAKDLAKVCRAHGESMDYVKELSSQSNYYGPQTANLQFIAVMLRLGDILHFSHDRAPRSLFVEKMINSKESLKHWRAKFQGINYSLNEMDENGRKKIKYMAYCDEPSLYYFIHEYLKWVDIEISNYFDFFNQMKYFSRMGVEADKYHLNISEKVDRSQIRYNEIKFTPVDNLKFTLNQTKILELLMGVGLYKDKFLCLRELYQNALDASRCMTAILKEQQGIEKRGNIEFGIKEVIENNIKRKYIYCRDNGIGMTKEIVENYFLNIGNSFYKSREFQKLKSTWISNFQPTSQFGIGILSCFMIGDKIEVTTMPLNETENNWKSFSFSIDGPHENFYFMKPDELDLEEIGTHGTLIKVYLDPEIDINDEEIEEDLKLLIKGSSKSSYRSKNLDLMEIWDKCIYKYIYSFIGIPDKLVDVHIRFNNNVIKVLEPWNTLFSFEDKEIEKIRLIYSDFSYIGDGYNPIEDYLRVKDNIKVDMLKVATTDIEYNFILSLPLPNLDILDWRVLNFEECLYKHSAILVDGILVSNADLRYEFDFKRDFIRNGIVNFVGSERPDISVDRNNITKLSDSLVKQFEELAVLVVEKIIQSVQLHLKQYDGLLTKKQKLIMWDYIFKKFDSLTELLIKYTVEISADLPLVDISLFLEEHYNVTNFVTREVVEFNKLDLRYLNKIEKLIMMGKLLDAKDITVTSDKVIVKSQSLKIFKHERSYRDDDMLPAVIKADSWGGDHEEYDLVSSLWPIVPERLYKKFNDFNIQDIIIGRSKTTDTSSNSLAGLAKIDPVLVHPIMGIFSKREDSFWRKSNWVGRFENPVAKFWLFELNQHGDLIRENNEDFFLFVFIPPKELSDEELTILEDFKNDIDYYNGVKNGWSILILGNTGEWVIMPGITKREELVKLIKPSFWKRNNKIVYSFVDGTLVRDLL
ncbi:HD domain-containing protein [Bacillus thuringiensis]|uniref:HD domain-containing protein n=2 Tax=Bacillaceae TaxID=186817 RepID=UPI000BF49398|nr:ATP-binding protein [Bacillus thuringiensis]PFP05758.1 hypothetical protein COJ91_17035 [Bacillus thuringiensis]PGP55201.1 hypothetical protein CN992_07810 [Bacillus thuringiensis]PGY51927.1 hypothetical protein COE24_29330 [Bacillus thuringiensis]